MGGRDKLTTSTHRQSGSCPYMLLPLHVFAVLARISVPAPVQLPGREIRYQYSHGFIWLSQLPFHSIENSLKNKTRCPLDPKSILMCI